MSQHKDSPDATSDELIKRLRHAANTPKMVPVEDWEALMREAADALEDSPDAKNEGEAALRLLAEVADAMNLSLGDTVSVAKMRPLVLGKLSAPSETAPKTLSEFVHADEATRERIGAEVVAGAIYRQNAKTPMTPMTDSEAFTIAQGEDRKQYQGGEYVRAAVARQLERELAECKASREPLLKFAKEEAAPSAIVTMPEEPTVEMIYAIAHPQWPSDRDAGVDAQRRIGIAVVPPRVEYEEAYGQYRRMYEISKGLK